MIEWLNYNCITVYPVCSYLFYIFCKHYYKNILHNNLLAIDMYDNNNYYIPKVDINTDEYFNNVLFAFTQIPT
jgi:hypothetical protein